MRYVFSAAGGRKNRGPAGEFPGMQEAFDESSFRGLGYRLMPPLEIEPGKLYPLIVSLHGGGGIGDDNRSQLRWWNGLMAQGAWRRAHPSYVLAPQAAPGATWGDRTEVRGFRDVYIKNALVDVLNLVEFLGEEFPVDRSRIYAVGSSMGGSGVWNIVQARPSLFAAAIPVCPGRPPADIAALAGTPIWLFHGDLDQIVPVDRSRATFEKVKAAGGTIMYTEIRGIRHNSWIQAFAYRGDDPDRGFVTRFSDDSMEPAGDVWDWLFRQRRPASSQ